MFNKFIILLLALYLPTVNSTEYISPNAFVQEIFAGKSVDAKLFWIQKKYKKKISQILQHKPGFLRTRYWEDADKTVWILEEIGKTKPITVGVVIENNTISQIKVLAFRESRGWEVKHDFFTDQFKGSQLNDDLRLSQSIDGISGATLSVRALNKIAQLALFFNQQLVHEKK
jgi:hypothetical protein